MNWKRGLYRIWAALSGIWILGWLTVIGLDVAQSRTLLAWYGVESPALRLAFSWENALIIFAPPILLGAFFAVIGWVITGFQNDQA